MRRTHMTGGGACLAGGVMDSLIQNDFEGSIEKSKNPALVAFISPDCKPCNLMARDLAELEKDYAGRIGFFQVNTAENLEMAKNLAVVSTPTLILFMEGKPVMRMVGYVTKLDIRNRVDEYLKQNSRD